MAFKFEIGDRVRLSNEFFIGILKAGTTGTVTNRGILNKDRPEYCIQLDESSPDIAACWVYEVDLEAAE
jgi:hypothetical protein